MKLLNTMFYIQERTDDAYLVSFNQEHLIYKAHFPGQPITPGVCIIKLLEELLELSVGQRIELSEVKNLKFIRPISPLDDERMNISFEQILQDTDGVRSKGVITCKDKVCTKFSLKFKKQ